MTGEQFGGTTGTLPPGMHPAMLPAEPPTKPPRRREGLFVAVAAIVGAMVVLGGLVGFQRWQSGDDEVAATIGQDADESPQSDEVDEGPPAATTPESETEENPDGATGETDGTEAESQPEPEAESEQPVDPPVVGRSIETAPCPAEYDAVICDAAEFVQQTRGRPFKDFPVIELLGDAEFDAALLDDFEEYRTELDEDERVLKALGLVPMELSLQETFRSLLESGVVGFYDPEDKRLVVRGGDFDLYAQLILVHELVHAFDDQWFDLNRDDFENEDAEYGFSAVVEGNASRVEELWRDDLSAEDRAALRAEELTSLSLEDLNRLRSLPEVILQLQASPYVDGQRYVESLFDEGDGDGEGDDGGEAAVDRSLADPPDSSERVLNPSRDEAELAITELTQPPTDGPVVSDGTLGELLIGFWLGDIAASGWGGDRYAVWEEGAGACLAVDLAADTATDLLELETAAARWQAEDEANRSVETVATVDQTLLRVTGCY